MDARCCSYQTFVSHKNITAVQLRCESEYNREHINDQSDSPSGCSSLNDLPVTIIDKYVCLNEYEYVGCYDVMFWSIALVLV